VVGPTAARNCGSAGSYPVSDTWTLSNSYSGWEAVEVLLPVHVKSNQASFILNCLPKLNIHAEYQGDVWLTGTNFGAAQGTRNISVDGKLITNMPGWYVESWRNDLITVGCNCCDIFLFTHVYQIAITSGSTIISNTATFTCLYYHLDAWQGGNELSYPAGGVFQFGLGCFPTRVSSLDIRLDGVPLTVESVA